MTAGVPTLLLPPFPVPLRFRVRRYLVCHPLRDLLLSMGMRRRGRRRGWCPAGSTVRLLACVGDHRATDAEDRPSRSCKLEFICRPKVSLVPDSEQALTLRGTVWEGGHGDAAGLSFPSLRRIDLSRLTAISFVPDSFDLDSHPDRSCPAHSPRQARSLPKSTSSTSTPSSKVRSCGCSPLPPRIGLI